MSDNGFPFGDPSVSGNLITVDEAMQQPTLITRSIANLLVQDYWAGKLFTPSGDVTGGAVIFERPNPLATDLFVAPEASMRQLGPGDEIPEVGFVRGVPTIARPKRFGGGFFMTKEAVKRNDQRQLGKNSVRLANTMIRDMELLAIAELNAVITAESRQTSPVSSKWAALNALTLVNRTSASTPASQILDVVVAIDEEQRGHKLDSVVFASSDWAEGVKYYGDAAGFTSALADVGIVNIDRTPRKTAGSCTLYQAGAVGQLRQEFPVEEESEYIKRKRSWWYDLDYAPLMFIDDQFALMELQGIS